MNLTEIASASALLKKELAPLAEKLGEGAEYTFALFIRQVYVNAFIKLLLIVPGILLVIFGYKWTKGFIKENSNDDSGLALFTIGLVILGIFFILMPLAGLIQALVNPEYQAIKLILEVVKNN